MSEVIVNPGSNTGLQFGLEVVSELPVTITTSSTPGGATTVRATPGADVIRSDATSTTPLNISGLENRDVLGGGAVGDNIRGGPSDDRIAGLGGNDILDGEDGNDNISGGSGDDQITGGNGLDFITGEEGNDLIEGGRSDDAIFGSDGNDRLFGEAGNDQIYGGSGNDQISGGAGDDRLFGDDGDDELTGDAGGDRLRGGAGDDILIPGKGQDIIRGGAGSDTFRFTADSGKQVDRIQDYNPGEDIIQISKALLPGSNLPNTLSNATFAIVERIGSASTDAQIVYESATGRVLYNPSNGVPVPLFNLGKNLEPVASDFKIIG